jgi:hypothetical protein
METTPWHFQVLWLRYEDPASAAGIPIDRYARFLEGRAILRDGLDDSADFIWTALIDAPQDPRFSLKHQLAGFVSEGGSLRKRLFRACRVLRPFLIASWSKRTSTWNWRSEMGAAFPSWNRVC